MWDSLIYASGMHLVLYKRKVLAEFRKCIQNNHISSCGLGKIDVLEIHF